jgi:hypothetical protein
MVALSENGTLPKVEMLSFFGQRADARLQLAPMMKVNKYWEQAFRRTCHLAGPPYYRWGRGFQFTAMLTTELRTFPILRLTLRALHEDTSCVELAAPSMSVLRHYSV